ncbi:uncharacterized protein STEHIDRAFT_157879 [Stereum hirsutum FP-91666 SS1]|uniref:uncharacterized protein n=1 Tax=Stereum hirsutum (strain FP-91666) TaxID=721885 RepID=UPI000444960E|nr:uncharacterized protein STEHIDRAFT_157879 [Stereum hirsutum FP-91666 SS1]EIM85233.1 hypothetical protein STEHIDRAFT_157879 [Stereum hirsutum FP-91666 SS1]
MSPPPPPSNPHPTFKLFNHSVTISQIQAVIPPHLPEHDMRTSLLYLVRDQIQVLVVRFGIYYVDLLLSPLCSSRVWWAARVFLKLGINWWLQGLALTGLWVFGDKSIFVTVITLSTSILLKRGMNLRGDVVLLSITLGVFSLSTVHWAVSVNNFISEITGEHGRRNTIIREVFNAVVLINLSISTTIAFRSAITALFGSIAPPNAFLGHAIKISQVTNLVFSLITNVIATSLIGIWAWEYRRSIRDILQSQKGAPSLAEHILVLLAESGIAYCVSSTIALIGMFINIRGGTMGAIYTGIHVQIAGMYPSLIVILVKNRRTSKVLATIYGRHSLHPIPDGSANNSDVLHAMHFNENPAVSNQRGTTEISPVVL